MLSGQLSCSQQAGFPAAPSGSAGFADLNLRKRFTRFAHKFIKALTLEYLDHEYAVRLQLALRKFQRGFCQVNLPAWSVAAISLILGAISDKTRSTGPGMLKSRAVVRPHTAQWDGTADDSYR
jgi:hypothetical protein